MYFVIFSWNILRLIRDIFTNKWCPRYFVFFNGTFRIPGKSVHQQILNYYKVNEVSQFMYSRPFKRPPARGQEDNEFASLWIERTILRTSYQLPGILRWFPVVSTEVRGNRLTYCIHYKACILFKGL